MFIGQHSTVSRNAAKARWYSDTNRPPSWRHRGWFSTILRIVGEPTLPNGSQKGVRGQRNPLVLWL